MKNLYFLTVLIMSLILIFHNSALARQVQVYDKDLSNINQALQRIGFKTWGIEYTRHNGILYCKTNFGDSMDNMIIYQVNDNDARSIAKIIVTSSRDVLNAYPSYQGLQLFGYEMGKNTGEVAGAILSIIGVTDEEGYKMLNEIQTHYYNSLSINPYIKHYIKSSTVWASKINRIIEFTFEMGLNDKNMFEVNFYILAYN